MAAVRSATAGCGAALDRPDRGVWALGDAASARAADAVAAAAAIEALARLADFAPPDPRSIRAVLGRADAAIRAARPQTGGGAGASMAVLHLATGTATLLWAGDCRAYRWRAGAIRCLTSDHGLATATIDAPPVRTIGGALPVEIATTAARVLPGDRLLLCTRALAAAVPASMIARRLRLAVADAADALVEAALCAGARATPAAIAIEVG